MLLSPLRGIARWFLRGKKKSNNPPAGVLKPPFSLGENNRGPAKTPRERGCLGFLRSGAGLCRITRVRKSSDCCHAAVIRHIRVGAPGRRAPLKGRGGVEFGIAATRLPPSWVGTMKAVKTVQESLRHADSKVTLDIYTQGLMPVKRAAQRKVIEMIVPIGSQASPIAVANA